MEAPGSQPEMHRGFGAHYWLCGGVWLFVLWPDSSVI